MSCQNIVVPLAKNIILLRRNQPFWLQPSWNPQRELVWSESRVSIEYPKLSRMKTWLNNQFFWGQNMTIAITIFSLAWNWWIHMQMFWSAVVYGHHYQNLWIDKKYLQRITVPWRKVTKEEFYLIQLQVWCESLTVCRRSKSCSFHKTQFFLSNFMIS